MKLVVAPDKFKGCLTAGEVGDAIAAGARAADPAIEIDVCPMADGGEGLVDALVTATGGLRHRKTVTGPLPHMRVSAEVGILGDQRTAVMEMSSAAGLALLTAEQRDPRRTTTFGVGQLLRFATETLDIKRILLGLGGSATVDGGAGCAQACGAVFTADKGAVVRSDSPALTGGDLMRLRSVDASASLARFRGIELIAACDVRNPLLGPSGAARVFGPQKGALPGDVEMLEAGLVRLSTILGDKTSPAVPGSGAAGGMGYGVLAFLGGTLQPGFDIVQAAVNFPQRLANADLCITGEGRLDSTSLCGKVVGGVAGLCKAAQIPCAAICGSISATDEQVRALGLDGVASLTCAGVSQAEALANAKTLIAAAAKAIVLARR